jgi:hypothetical protein
MKKLLTTYVADAGTCVINGIGIENGVGDGCFGVYYDDKPTQNMLEKRTIPKIWIDLRNEYPVIIHGYDCDVNGKEMYGQMSLADTDFPGAKGLKIMVSDGNIIFVKWF